MFRASNWTNFWIPAAGGLLVAGALSDAATGGWNHSQGLGWLILIGGGLVLTWLAIPTLGFAMGIIHYEPADMSQLFYAGWRSGRGVRKERF